VACFGFGEPTSEEFLLGDAGEIGLDVENGGAIEHIDATDVQGGAVAAKEFNGSEGDRVGAQWRAGGENAVAAIIGRWPRDQVKSLGAIELPQNDEVGEAFDVCKAGREFRENFQGTICVVLSAEAFGDLAWFFVWAGDKADGAGGEHGAARDFKS